MSATSLFRAEVATAMAVALVLGLVLLVAAPAGPREHPQRPRPPRLLRARGGGRHRHRLDRGADHRRHPRRRLHGPRGRGAHPHGGHPRLPRRPARRPGGARAHRRGPRHRGPRDRLGPRVAAAGGRGPGQPHHDLGRHHGRGRLLDAGDAGQHPRRRGAAARPVDPRGRLDEGGGHERQGGRDPLALHGRGDAQPRDRRDPQRLAREEPLHARGLAGGPLSPVAALALVRAGRRAPAHPRLRDPREVGDRRRHPERGPRSRRPAPCS